MRLGFLISFLVLCCDLFHKLLCDFTDEFDVCRPLPENPDGHCLEPVEYGKCCEYHGICDGYICPDGKLSTFKGNYYNFMSYLKRQRYWY